MNKELEQQARGWYEAEERKRLASVLNTNGDPMFGEETISVASAANARSLAPSLAAFAAHLEAQSKPIQPLVGVLRKLRGAIHAGPDTNTGSRAGHVESLVILGLVDEIDAALSSQPIQGEVATVPLSPEMVEKIMDVVDSSAHEASDFMVADILDPYEAMKALTANIRRRLSALLPDK